MQLLIMYSRLSEAREKGWPRQGSEIVVESIDALAVLRDVMGHNLILHLPGYRPVWAELYDDNRCPDPDGDDFYYAVKELPAGYRSLCWLEIYNGWRE